MCVLLLFLVFQDTSYQLLLNACLEPATRLIRSGQSSTRRAGEDRLPRVAARPRKWATAPAWRSAYRSPRSRSSFPAAYLSPRERRRARPVDGCSDRDLIGVA